MYGSHLWGLYWEAILKKAALYDWTVCVLMRDPSLHETVLSKIPILNELVIAESCLGSIHTF